MKSNFSNDIINSKFKDEKSFYNNVFSNNDHPWEYTPSKTIVKLLDRIESNISSILDIWIWDWRHTEYFLQRYPNAKIVGVDFSENSINFCKNRFKNKNVDLFMADLTKNWALNMLWKFDLILERSVANHIRESGIQNFKDNILNALNKEKYLISAQINIPDTKLLKKGTKYMYQNWHYTRSYEIDEVIDLYKELNHIDFIEKSEEIDENHKRVSILINTVLFKKG